MKEDGEVRVVICGPPGPHPSEGSSLVGTFDLLLGPKSGLTEEQLRTVHWLRRIGARPSLKKNMVRVKLNKITLEQYERIAEILGREGIKFQIS